MTSNRVIHASTNIVYVNTAIDSNAVVLLSTATYFAQTISVRDIGGKAGPSNTISISTIDGVSIPTLSNLQILKPFDSLTFTAPDTKTWKIGNSFAYNTVGLDVTIKQPQLSSIVFKDLEGNASIFNVSNATIQLNRSNIQLGRGTLTVPDPLIQKSLHVSTINVMDSNAVSVLVPFYATGVATGDNSNIQISYDGLNWSNYSVEFTNGYGTDIKLTSNYTVITGLTNYFVTGLTNNFFIQYTKIQLYYIENNTINPRVVYEFPYTFNSNIDIQYAYGTDNYNVILMNDPSTNSTALLFSSNITSTSAWSNLTHESIGSLSGGATTLATGNNVYLVGSTNNVLLVIRSISPYESSTLSAGTFTITNVKYSKVDNMFLIIGYNTNDTIFNVACYSNVNDNTFPTPNVIQDVTQDNLATFRAFDVYINQGTAVEAGLPRVVYVGSNTSSRYPLIYYSYSQDITQQSNFYSIPPSNFGDSVNIIYSITLHGSNLYVSTDNDTYGMAIIDSNGFANSNLYAKNSNNLYKTYAIGSSTTVINNSSENIFDSNTRMSISGTLETNFIRINSQQFSVSNATLYSGNYLLNPVGASIEFAIRHTLSGELLTLVSYPLYSGQLNDFQNGWWPQSFAYYVHGFTVQPGYKLIAHTSNNSTGAILCSNINTTYIPIYSNVGTPLIRYSRASYILSPLNT